MSERPTPETDAAELIYDGNLSSGYADVDVCRRMERERDEAQEENEEQARLLGMSAEREANLRGKVGRLEDKAERWRQDALAYMRKSDKLRAQVQRLKDGHEGCCYACEPVGELNVELEAKVKGLEEERDEARAERDQLKSLKESDGACWVEIDLALGTREKGDSRCSLDRVLAAIRERDIAREALQRLADCDWVITPRDRMDAVREIAREALAKMEAAK